MSSDHCGSVCETVAVLSDSELVADITRGISEVSTGDVLTADELDVLLRGRR